MDKIYRFSPVKNEETITDVLIYLTSELEKLSQELFNKTLPITTLKIFAHYPEEYDYLHKLISNMGPKASFSSDTSLYVEVSKKIKGYSINYLGVRIVDPYRMQVGCGDYEIADFEEFKEENINKSPFVRNFRDDMVELWHPDFDVLGYIVPIL